MIGKSQFHPIKKIREVGGCNLRPLNIGKNSLSLSLINLLKEFMFGWVHASRGRLADLIEKTDQIKHFQLFLKRLIFFNRKGGENIALNGFDGAFDLGRFEYW